MKLPIFFEAYRNITWSCLQAVKDRELDMRGVFPAMVNGLGGLDGLRIGIGIDAGVGVRECFHQLTGGDIDTDLVALFENHAVEIHLHLIFFNFPRREQLRLVPALAELGADNIEADITGSPLLVHITDADDKIRVDGAGGCVKLGIQRAGNGNILLQHRRVIDQNVAADLTGIALVRRNQTVVEAVALAAARKFGIVDICVAAGLSRLLVPMPEP